VDRHSGRERGKFKRMFMAEVSGGARSDELFVKNKEHIWGIHALNESIDIDRSSSISRSVSFEVDDDLDVTFEYCSIKL